MRISRCTLGYFTGRRLATVLLLAVFYRNLVAFAAGDDDEVASWFSNPRQRGDGTYYGEIDPGDGNCAFGNVDKLSAFRRADMYVAINDKQYEGSMACGMCVKLKGNGKGSGNDPIPSEWQTAIVVDRCPECAEGDLDLAQSGDGRWDLRWKAVPCPGTKRRSFQYAFEGSNDYYLKLQVRNSYVPISKVELQNGGRYRQLSRTSDNHFEATGGDFQTPFGSEMRIRITSVFGEQVTDDFDALPAENTEDNPINGSAQFKERK